jgi:hypothetical protein
MGVTKNCFHLFPFLDKQLRIHALKEQALCFLCCEIAEVYNVVLIEDMRRREHFEDEADGV